MITLIIPPSSFLIDDRVFPSLGILKVAAVLEQAHIPVRVIDLSGKPNFEEALLSELTECDNYGLTATMPQMPAAVKIAQIIRKKYPRKGLILGGPHVTLMQASRRIELAQGKGGRATRALGELGRYFDVLVAGDGEKAIFEALHQDAPSMIDGDKLESPLFLKSAELNEAPLPARHLIDIASYRYQIDGVPTQSMIAQLGCPFMCTFCGGRRSPFLRKVRTRDTAHVISEMWHLYETYGTRGFMFLDDELNVNKQFIELLKGICALQNFLGVEFRLRGLIKSELLTEEQAEWMYRAGFRQLLIGFESGSERILENIQKKATVDDNTRCVEILRKHGIRVKALMSIGHAGESFETVQATRDWLLQVQPTDFDVTIITVYPGTPYWDDAAETSKGIWTYTAKNQDRLHAKEVDQLKDVNFYKGMPGQYQSFVYTDYLSETELVQLRDSVEDEVRKALKIPYPSTPAEINFEHSMAMH